jgi:hypothetical protein
MNKDRLKKLARDKQFIPGIFNYCDRWCERCPQTSRCLNFVISEDEFADSETRDIKNEAFWKKLFKIFSLTFALLKEEAEERGLDLDIPNIETLEEEAERSPETTEDLKVCRLAKYYSNLVEEWFKSAENLFLAAPEMMKEDLGLEEAFEVIRWYQHFIYIKLRRALEGAFVDQESEIDEFPRDSEGSAKIALIGIDRSIAAWGTVYPHDPLHDETILRFLAHLDLLKEEVQNTFPGARSFLRPGFDKIDLNG